MTYSACGSGAIDSYLRVVRSFVMADRVFREPRIVLNRIYTRGGDGGETRLVNGRRVRKDDPRVEAYGTVDELNAAVGQAKENLLRAATDCPELAPLGETLLRVQHELFNLGSEVATDSESLGSRQPRVLPSDVERLEAEVDLLNEQIPPLASFVLPGGSPLNADLHVCRAVCRRAERRVVSLSASQPGLEMAIRYLNRLSDAFFVWSRWACQVAGVAETLWQPNQSA